MSKIRFLFLFFIAFQLCNSQNLDSLYKSIAHLTDIEKIKFVVNTPFDAFASNIKGFEVLADSSIIWSRRINDSLLLAESLQKKASILHFTSKTEESIKLSLTAIKIFETIGDIYKAGEIYADLGWRIKYLDLNKAFKYMKQGLKILEAGNSLKTINPAYDNFGALFGLRKQWDSALYYHNKSLKIKKQLKDSVGIPFGYSHLANVYLKTKRFQLAKKYLDSALIIREKRNDIYGITDTQLYYGDLFFEKGEYDKAINSFEKGYELSRKNNYHPLEKYASEYLFKSYKAINKYDEALKFHLQYTQLKDSILNVETNNKIHQLEIEFQTEKKEKEILSQRADIAEKELSLSQKNIQILLLAVLAIIMSLLGYIFYSQQKLKNRQLKRENELKEALLKIEAQNKLQEQRFRISRDLHDNIGAQLTFIISSLDNLKFGFKIPDKLDNKLKSISEFTSSTILELRDTIWAMNKAEITIDDLQARISNFIEKADLAASNTNFNFKCNNLNKDVALTSVQGMNVYRIIQEAINNAIKYAEASNIEVLIDSSDYNIKFSISDDGNGFDINEIEFGNGLNNIKKRAQEINAELKINSTKSKGTAVILIQPLNT